MKKRLEAELISIAHRILKLKNKSEVDQLHLETRKLYETLSVLKFHQDNFEQLKNDVSQDDLDEKLAQSLNEKTQEIIAEAPQQTEETSIIESNFDVFENNNSEEIVVVDEAKNEENPDDVEAVEEPNKEEKPEIDFEPLLELASEAPFIEVENPTETIAETTIVEEPKIEEKSVQQISFEDLLGANYSEPVFVKSTEIEEKAEPKIKASKSKKEEESSDTLIETEEEKPKILNEKITRGINIGLNDRIGFVKYLFNDSNEDFNRVLSQLNTFDTYLEAKNFVEEMVKPDYNNWKGQDDYAERFMEIVERKFN